MMEILRRAVACADAGDAAALASVIASSGSLPMSRRSVMLVHADGTQVGTVGGGCLEAEVHALATRVIRGGSAVLGRFTLTESKAGAEGLNCGGTVRILVQGIRTDESAPIRRAAVEAIDRGEDTVVVTAFRPEEKAGPGGEAVARPVRILGSALVGWSGIAAGAGCLEDGSLPTAAIERVLDASQELIGTERSLLLEGLPGPAPDASIAFFLESLTQAPVLYLFGGGHVGRAVAGVAGTAGFRVVVVDDRPEFASPARFPGAERTLVLPLRGAVGSLPVDSRSYILAVTRGHQHDEPIIEEALRTPARWIGMIGSRRKKRIMWDRLQARGVAPADLDRVSCPVGLPVGADTPGEIAVSIVAEMIRVRRGAPDTGAPTPAGVRRTDPGDETGA